MGYKNMQEIKIMFSDGTSQIIRGESPTELYRKYLKLKKQSNVELIEMWSLGNPGEHDIEYRYSRLLRAWEKGTGDLDVSQFYKGVAYTQEMVEADLERHLRNYNKV